MDRRAWRAIVYEGKGLGHDLEAGQQQHMYGYVSLLFASNYHNTVNWLYPNIK